MSEKHIVYTRILVPLDGSETAWNALESALELAVDMAAELRPIYVVDVPVLAFDSPGFDPTIIRDAYEQEGQRVTAQAETRMKQHGVAGVARVEEVAGPGEDVAERILLAARDWHADLIVMGTHGRRGLRRLVLGSVAERVLRSTTLPVLLISSGGQAAAQETRAASEQSADA